jgi:UDP-glucose 4-epimerase
MPFIAKVAAGHQEELKVFGNDYPTADGTGVRDYIHVMDLAEGHAAALDFLFQNTGWHTINLGTGRGYSVLDMIHAFQNVSGKEVPYRIVSRRAGDVTACYADPKKASELLNWIAKRNLDEMCASSWRFQQTYDSGVCHD